MNRMDSSSSNLDATVPMVTVDDGDVGWKMLDAGILLMY